MESSYVRSDGAGPGMMMKYFRIMNTKKKSVLMMKHNAELTFAWQEDADAFCAAMNLGARYEQSIKDKLDNEQIDKR
jgi:hypothetical protein